MTDMLQLDGQVAFVTGAGGGIRHDLQDKRGQCKGDAARKAEQQQDAGQQEQQQKRCRLRISVAASLLA